ncbi:hypothetical protein [Thiohalocapsa marina]|uniref:hypothetical protein n=1 Tax=Thiohalocapsa marina TaxID=424902 RepID=UPI0036D89E1A
MVSGISQLLAAQLAGVTDRRMRQIEHEQDPPPRLADGTYDAAAFGRWLKRRWERDIGIGDDGQVYDYERERARLTKAQADRTELEAAELRGEMARAEDVIEAWGRMLGAARARLLSMPAKVAPRVRAATSDQIASGLIEAEVLEALEELSSDGLPDRTRSRRARLARDSSTAPEADGEPVGGRAPAPKPGKRSRARKVAD